LFDKNYTKNFINELFSAIRKSIFKCFVLYKDEGKKSQEWLDGYFEAVKDIFEMTQPKE